MGSHNTEPAPGSTRSASPSSASATAPRPWSRAWSTTRRRPVRAGARSHARPVRRLPRPRRRVRRRVRRRRQEGRPRPRRGDRRQREQHHQDLRRAADRRHRPARPTYDGLGEYYREIDQESDERAGRRRRRCSRTPRSTCWSPTCRSAPRRPTASTPRPRSTPACAFVNALPVFIASDPTWAQKFTDAGRADRRRRHQEPGRRDHHAPRAGQAVRGPRRRAAAHVPAQLRRQHGLHEHAGAQAPALEEDLQDPVGHLADPARDGARPTSTSARRTTCRGSTTASGPTSASRAAPSATPR